jgi:hypothetical protein
MHLELEVGVVVDGHELGVARSPQHRVVGSSEPDHLEREGFSAEVGGSSEADGQIELSKGLDALPGDDPMKGRRSGPDHGQIDLQEPEGLGIDDVEAAASVHEDLGEPDIADDGVDNERVLSWARHAVGVVALVEGDGLVGPVEVDWRRHLYRADLSALLLAVPSRGVRHLPTVDHETAVDLGELLYLVALLLVVVLAFATFRRGPGLMEVAPKHDAFLKGVLDGTLVVGARLLEQLVEQVGPSGRLPKVPVLGGSDKICVGGVTFRLRLLLAFLLRAALGGRLGDVFLLASLRLLVLPEDGLDRLLTRGELGGDVHQLARPGGSLATQFAHQVVASGVGEERADDI